MSDTPDKTPVHRPPDELFTLVTDTWSAPYWEHAARGEFVVPQCGQCKEMRMPPTPFCPHCRSQEIDWKQLSGRGTVFSHSAVMRPVVESMREKVPFVVAVVDLEDAPGCRVITNIIDCTLDEIFVGAKVQVSFDRHRDGQYIPRFHLVREAR